MTYRRSSLPEEDKLFAANLEQVLNMTEVRSHEQLAVIMGAVCFLGLCIVRSDAQIYFIIMASWGVVATWLIPPTLKPEHFDGSAGLLIIILGAIVYLGVGFLLPIWALTGHDYSVRLKQNAMVVGGFFFIMAFDLSLWTRLMIKFGPAFQEYDLRAREIATVIGNILVTVTVVLVIFSLTSKKGRR